MGQLRNDKLLKSIGKTFKKIREEKELTQEEVYNDTGIHIGRIEVAQTNLSVSTLHELCKYYGLSLTEFFEMLG